MRLHPTPARRDEGSALIITLLALALVTALASTVSVLAIDNLQSSKRAQQAGAAIDAADAGVAQAMTYLRSSGVRGLRCAPGCGANAWGNSTTPTSVTLPDGGGSYRVWIEPVHAFPANDPGTYRVHATGAVDDATRSVSVDVEVTTSSVPKGLFAKSFTGGGSASVTRESVFSTGCVWQRSKIHTVATDPEAPENLDAAYGIPVGVHTSNYITDANGSAQYCSTSTSKLIHKSGSGAHATQTPCSDSYPYDQDKLGGAPTSACSAVQQALPAKYPDYYGPLNLDGDATTTEVTGSFVKDDASLLSLFDLEADPFTDAELDQLRTIAQSQDNYWTSSSGWDTPDESNAVMFFDLEDSDLGGTVDLNDFQGTAFSRAAGLADDDTCPTTSLLIVIVGGNVKVNSNTQMAASIFLTSPAPYGQVVKANGTADFIGTIYADKINLVGNFDASLDPCFLANTSPALLSLSVGSYREDDRGTS